jgi:hypothetical protein
MQYPEEKEEIDAEEVIHTGSAVHGFGEEDFDEVAPLDDDEDDEENTVED